MEAHPLLLADDAPSPKAQPRAPQHAAVLRPMSAVFAAIGISALTLVAVGSSAKRGTSSSGNLAGTWDATEIVSNASLLKNVEVTCGSDVMALACTLTADWVGGSGLSAEVAVRYRPLKPASQLGDVWSPTTSVTPSKRKIKLHLFRLRPRTLYEYSVYLAVTSLSHNTTNSVSLHNISSREPNTLRLLSRRDTADDDDAILRTLNGTFSVGATGLPAFDAQYGQLAVGVGDPSAVGTWQVAAMSYSTNQGGVVNSTWAGLVMVDAEGFVCWYTQMDLDLHASTLQVGPFDQVEDYQMAYGVWFNRYGGFPIPDMDDEHYNRTLEGVLVTVDALGETKKVKYIECSSTIELNAVTMHELRSTSDSSVLVSGFGIHQAENFSVADKHYESVFVASGTLNLWKPLTGAVTQVTDLWKKLSPKFTGLHSCASCTEVMAVCGRRSLPTIDYMHISSAAMGTDGNYLVSLRNLDMVASINGTYPHDVNWIISSSIDLSTSYLTFSFENDDDAFYFPHHVTQLGTDRILVMDNGMGRPSGNGNYTRAVEYVLDFDAHSAHVAWQFEYPLNVSHHSLASATVRDILKHDLQSNVGNSVTKLPNGHYLVAFSDLVVSVDDDNRAGTDPVQMDTLIFDVAPSGRLHSAHLIEGDSMWGEGTYRVLPYESIGGESTSCPLSRR